MNSYSRTNILEDSKKHKICPQQYISKTEQPINSMFPKLADEPTKQSNGSKRAKHSVSTALVHNLMNFQDDRTCPKWSFIIKKEIPSQNEYQSASTLVLSHPAVVGSQQARTSETSMVLI